MQRWLHVSAIVPDAHRHSGGSVQGDEHAFVADTRAPPTGKLVLVRHAFAGSERVIGY